MPESYSVEGNFRAARLPLDVNQRHPHVLSSPFKASVKCLDEIPLRLLRHGASATLRINDSGRIERGGSGPATPVATGQEKLCHHHRSLRQSPAKAHEGNILNWGLGMGRDVGIGGGTHQDCTL